MRKALVSLTTGYCQSTVACKTRLSCLDFASWLSHQLHHRQPLMKKVIESPGRKLKCKDIRQVLDGLKYSIQTTVTLCFKSKVSSQFPIVLTSTLECFSTISESCFRSSSKYWKLRKKKKKKSWYYSQTNDPEYGFEYLQTFPNLRCPYSSRSKYWGSDTRFMTFSMSVPNCNKTRNITT